MRDRFWLAALLLAVTLAALPVLTYPLGRDQGEFATIGRGILDGRIPYIDLWNPKPPAVFYVYAAAMVLLGRTTAALRAIDFVIVPLICLCMYWLGRRIANRRVGLWTALLFAVFYFTETFWTLTQNDGVVLLPMTLAVVCAFKATDATRRASWWAFAAGALSGLAVWFKYPFVLFGVVLFITQIFDRRNFLARKRRWLAFLGGGVLVGLAGIVYMAAIGALPALIESARVTSQYTALTFNARDFGELLQTHVGFRWQQWGLLWILAALWLVFHLRAPCQAEWRTVLFWVLAGLVIMLVQAKAYDYHWLPMLPPLALMAGESVERVIGLITPISSPSPVPQGLPMVASMEGEQNAQAAPPPLKREVGRGVKNTIPPLTALAFLCIMIISIWPRAWPYLTGQESQLAYYGRFQAGDDFIADESLEVATYLRERVAPGDSLFIWGFRPEVYYLSQLNPAVRFIFQFPLVADWYPQVWKQETVDILWAALPPYVLVLQADYMPWVTGSDEDSNTLLQAYTELNDWLIFNYERETQIGNFFLWRRKSP
jgi:hypothetical protein